MKLNHPTAQLYVPDGTAEEEALRRVTHLGIGAHQDDLEFMALHGILACFQQQDTWFGGVTCTNGAGSSRIGPYADCSDEAMIQVRREEQNLAARIGQYGCMIHLGYPSADIQKPGQADFVEDLITILQASRPGVVYTHNPADKHRSHIAVLSATLRALRALPPASRPHRVLGCEVWRNLDWLPDDAKVVLDVGGRDHLAAALNGVFDSQIAGGKRYDLAVMGRRLANATFLDSHQVDASDQVWFAMDLTPLVQDDSMDVIDYVQHLMDRFAADVREKLEAYFP
ncbi:MAG: PIG-L family deacetylase [Verrucomicrobia bacterium]|nr:PIG-L family deacetylase [Verrucomicrobiota bacterium]